MRLEVLREFFRECRIRLAFLINRIIDSVREKGDVPFNRGNQILDFAVHPVDARVGRLHHLILDFLLGLTISH